MSAAVYYVGRFAMLLGMFLLLEDIVGAGPMGPNPRLFGLGVLVFLGGWAITKAVKRT
jgi:hypothetical protein